MNHVFTLLDNFIFKKGKLVQLHYLDPTFFSSKVILKKKEEKEHSSFNGGQVPRNSFNPSMFFFRC